MGMTAATITVLRDGGSHGALTETTLYNGLPAGYMQQEKESVAGPFGEVSARIVDIFLINPINGALPTIKKGNVIRWNSVNYEVETALDLGGKGKRLKVTTHRVEV
jgi:hypothetical protein